MSDRTAKGLLLGRGIRLRATAPRDGLGPVSVRLATPTVDELPRVLSALGAWQDDGVSVQLHPGDLGWFGRAGAAQTAAALRTWSRGGELVAVGLLDGGRLVRWTVAPSARTDEALADEVLADLAAPERGVLAEGEAAVEAPPGTLLHDRLLEAGWAPGEPWTPLRRDLARPVEAPGMRIQVVGSGGVAGVGGVAGATEVAGYTAVHRSAFASPRLTPEAWGVMAAEPAFRAARSLLACDDAGVPVAEVTVWSAGPGRPGLLEPMGVHAGHRGRGYGRAICLAAAAALRDLGSSSALVCTPSANVAAVATYRAAGYAALPERLDRTRGE
ncbi:MAG: GNAT family N-acetyltransferase [Lapillicoccus sp.]